MKLTVTRKHLQGGHDQASHNPWKGYNKPGPTKVYHSSPARAAYSVMRRGLERGGEWFDRPPSVYFTAIKDEAIEFGAASKDFILVEFEIPDSMDNQIIVDDIANADFKWKSAQRIERDIPPRYIKNIYRYTGNSARVRMTGQLSMDEFNSLSEGDIHDIMETVFKEAKTYYTVVLVVEEPEQV